VRRRRRRKQREREREKGELSLLPFPCVFAYFVACRFVLFFGGGGVRMIERLHAAEREE
jgi:hypothetical protein